MIDLRFCDNMELMKQFPDKHFDLVIVDAPYFSGPEKKKYYGSEKSKAGVTRLTVSSKNWEVPGEDFFKEVMRVSKYYIIWGCNYYDFKFHSGRIIWDKVNYASDYSDCEIAATNLWDHTRLFAFMWNGMNQGSLSDGRKMEGNKKLNEKRIHPTQKPVQLYSWQLKKFVEKRKIKPHNIKKIKTLDTNAGSGSMAIACYDMNIQYTGCDNDEKYYNKANKRVRRATSQYKMFT